MTDDIFAHYRKAVAFSGKCQTGRIQNPLLGDEIDSYVPAVFCMFPGFLKYLLSFGSVSYDSDFDADGNLGFISFKKAEKTLEIQSSEHLVRLFVIDFPESELIERDIHRRITPNRREILGQHRKIVMITHCTLSFLRLDFIHMLMGIFYGMELRYDGGGCFWTDARQPRNIVGRISHQSLHIDELKRSYAHRLQHLLSVIALICRLTAFCLRENDLRPVRSDLKEISVSGNKRYGHTAILTSSRECSQDIVCFPTVHFDVADPHRRKKFPDERHLLMEFRRGRGPIALISLVFFMTEGRCRPVKCHSQVVRPLLLDNFSHDGEKAVNGIRMNAVRCSHSQRHSVKCPEHNAVAIYQNKFFIHLLT